MCNQTNLISLNPSDFVFFASEDVFPSMGMLVTLQFSQTHGIEKIREGMRHMLALFPRLRSRVVSKVFSYKIKILNNTGEDIERLFDEAFTVHHDLIYNTSDYFEFRREFLNRPFLLQEKLPIRIAFIPDNDKPVLLITIHHMTCDGLSFHKVIDTFMAYLNGHNPISLKIDNPSLWPAILETPFYRIPIQLYKSFKVYRSITSEKKHYSVVHSSLRPSQKYSKVNLHNHVLPFDVDTVKRTSKDLGCSLTVLILVALTHVFSRRQKEKQKGNTIAIYHTIDTRSFFQKSPLFGNYALFSKINIHMRYWDNIGRLVDEINKQLRRNVNRYKNKEMLFYYLIEIVPPVFLGKRILSYLIKKAKKNKLRMINGTCFVSTGGSLDRFNSHGPHAQVSEFVDSATINHMFVAITSLDGRISTNITYPEAEYSLDEIKDLVQSLDCTLAELLNSTT